MKIKRLLVLIMVFLLVMTSLASAEGVEFIGGTKESVQKEVNKYIEKQGSLTLKELAGIIVPNIELTYDNYEYYRSKINDTTNRNILKLYSEGVLEGDGRGYLNADRALTTEEIEGIIQRLETAVKPERPDYVERKKIPILMYHEINTLPKNGSSGLYVSRENFLKQLDALKKNGYNTVTMEQVYQHWTNKAPLPENPIVLSFDDGYLSHYNFASVELAKRGMTGTFYIITYNVRDGAATTPDMLKDMYDIGMEIGSHTVNHVDARHSSNTKILNEYKQSKTFLEKQLGVEIKHFCYPVGGVTEYSKQALRDLGYKTSVKTSYGKANINQGLLTLNRIRIDYYDSVKGFLNKVK